MVYKIDYKNYYNQNFHVRILINLFIRFKMIIWISTNQCFLKNYMTFEFSSREIYEQNLFFL